MERIRRWFSIIVGCKMMGMHNWTSKAQEGIKPSLIQTNAGVEGFFDYAKMYCKDCGEESDLNKGWKK